MGHDLTPIFQGEIDAEILDISLEEVSSDGWVGISEWTKYHNHAVVFAHFAEGGQLKTTHYDGQKRSECRILSRKMAESISEQKNGREGDFYWPFLTKRFLQTNRKKISRPSVEKSHPASTRPRELLIET